MRLEEERRRRRREEEGGRRFGELRHLRVRKGLVVCNGTCMECVALCTTQDSR